MKLTEDIILRLTDVYLPSSNGSKETPISRIKKFMLEYFRDFYYPWGLEPISYNLESFKYRIIDVSVGFIFLGTSGLPVKTEEGFAFGIQILVKRNEEEQPEYLGRSIGNLPVIALFGDFSLNNTPNPPKGIGTCWVRKTSPNSNWQYGVLTCEHVLSGISKGASVMLQQQTNGVSINGSMGVIGRPCIDAGIVEISSSAWPSSLQQITICTSITPGASINLSLPANPLTGFILRVSIDPLYFGASIGHRIFIDCYGAQGDSGSLLKQNNQAAGMYMGEIQYNANHSEGMCQGLEQVSKYFGIDLFV